MKTIRKSFSARLSLQVVMIASMVFGVVFSVLFFSSKRIVRQEAESHAGSELSGNGPDHSKRWRQYRRKADMD